MVCSVSLSVMLLSRFLLYEHISSYSVVTIYKSSVAQLSRQAFVLLGL